MSTASPLVEQALGGQNRQLTLLAARGLLPVAPGELVAMQVELAANADREIADAARQSLATVEARVVAPFLATDADHRVLAWFATNSRDGDLLATILRRRDVPTPVLVDLAGRLPADLQETLLLRQDRITAAPEILQALEDNPALSAYSQRRIQEYRQHLLREAPTAEEPEVVEVPEGPIGLEDPEVQAALEVVRAAPAAGEVDHDTGLSEGQIRMLPVPLRVKLARGAPRTLRQFLVRDNNPQVATTVIESNPLADSEVEQICRNRGIVEDVLEAIARQRRWMSKYPIVLALIANPRTPVAIAMKLVPRLSVRDLRNLSRDRGVSDPVRQAAMRLYKVKLK